MNSVVAVPDSAGSTQWEFIEALGDGVYGVDRQGFCSFVNKAALRMLGYGDANELLGRNMHEMIHHTRPDGSAFPQAECPLLHTAISGKAVRLENEMLWRRDGTPFFAEYSSFPVVTGGAITGSVITFSDTALRQDAQKRLAVQYAVSQVLSGSGPADTMLERILEAIGAGLNWDAGLFWRRSDNGSGHDVLRCMATWRSHDAGDASVFGATGHDSMLELGAGLPGQVWIMQAPIHIADLSPHSTSPRQAEAARHGLRSAFAFPIMDGKDVTGAIEFYASRRIDLDDSLLEAVLTLGHQIGQTLERRSAAHALTESEARFRTIANAIPQLAWMTNSSGAVVWYNQRWYDYTGASFEQMRGWGWKSVHHPDHIARVEQRLRESFSTGTEWEDTFPLRSREGTYHWFLSRALPIREVPDATHPNGRILGWFGSNTDVTQMREAARALETARDEAEAANQAKSTFIANMSHELRTPLSAIIGYAEMLAEEIEDGAEPAGLGKDIGKIEGNARHLLGLINDVLDLSKVESGKMEAYVEKFDVAEMVRSVAATVGALMEKKANKLDLQLDRDLGAMQSDVTRIRQLLLNLLSNAAKFTEDGTVTLAVERQVDAGADWLLFSVTDTGIGMTEEQLAKLFQRFQQADASTTRQFGGTGLGLALTKAFATLLGGEVTVTSAPGVGSRFAVRLPAVLGAAAGSGADAADSRGAGRRDVVLVVDDDQAQLDLTSRFLTKEGFVARTAIDGPTGLALARSLRPRAILLDVTMPGMDGWSVLSALKADPALAAIPVVMVTFQSERPLAVSLGAADYVFKPVDWNRLRLVMERFRDAEGDVLIVEDDAETRQRTRTVLEKHGWSVVEAPDGREALDHVARAVPRMILLDLNMPVMDGFQFLAELRQRPGCATVPVIVLTARDLTADDRRRLRGANQVLNKGDIGLKDLVETLRQLGLDG